MVTQLMIMMTMTEAVPSHLCLIDVSDVANRCLVLIAISAISKEDGMVTKLLQSL